MYMIPYSCVIYLLDCYISSAKIYFIFYFIFPYPFWSFTLAVLDLLNAKIQEKQQYSYIDVLVVIYM